MKLHELYAARYPGRILDDFPPLLSLDPGGTTGYSIFNKGKLLQASSITTIKHCSSADEHIILGELQELFDKTSSLDNLICICEDYRIYAHKLSRHTYSPVNTLRLIGAISLLCRQSNRPLKFQMAATVKPFCKDERLKEWGLMQTNRHSNDSIRHACYFMLFGDIDSALIPV